MKPMGGGLNHISGLANVNSSDLPHTMYINKNLIVKESLPDTLAEYFQSKIDLKLIALSTALYF